jgi:5-methylcytosine-specific restriction endonuclease McrA
MIKVAFAEPNSQEWLDWKADVQQATQQLIAQAALGEKPKIKDALYKKMRQQLFDAFHGKCAYCEAKFILDQTGDVEHFRPKGAVVDEHDQPVTIADNAGAARPHPGYYWLAYDWQNLLPSCSRCNRLTKTRDGRKVGKGTRFPVAAGRAAAPGEEAAEQPLFLHPAFDDPSEHLVFDADTGILAGKTPRGKLCIELLDLNRDGLPEARLNVYTSLKARIFVAINSLQFNALDQFLANVKVMNAYKRGEEEYACAGRKALEDLHTQLKALEDLLAVLNP